MSTDVEQRVVEMRFDNAQFEKNIQTSMKSLEEFDKTLDNLDSGKSLTELSRAADKVDLSNMTKQADAVRVSFSAMQVFAVNALNDVYRVAKNVLSKGILAPLNQIKTGGWSRATNIDQAKFQLEGLKVAWKDIEADISYAVDGTAYGLDAAAKAASQLVASGVQFGETFGTTGNSPMAKALRGISGLAAMTNSSYEDMARIVTAVAGQGKLMTIQMRQLELRGLNIAATMAKSMGTTEQAVRDMVTNGQVDFKMFSEAMDEAFGDHAKDANKTFEGAMDNMKSALSRIGQLFAAPIRSEAIPVFNELRLLFNTIKKTLVPLADDFERVARLFSNFLVSVISGQNNLSSLSNVMYGMRNIFRSVVMVIITFKRAVEEVFPGLKDFSYQFYQLTNHLLPTERSLEGIKNVFKALLTPLKIVGDAVKAGARVLGKVVIIIAEVISHFNELLSAFGFGLDPLFEFVRGTDLFGTALNIVAAVSTSAIAGVTAFVEVLSRIFSVIRKSEPFERFANALKNIAEVVVTLATGAFATVVKLFNTLFHGADKKSETVDMMEQVSEKAGTLVKTVSNLTPVEKFVNMLKSVAKTVVGLAGGALAAVVGLIEKLFSTDKKGVSFISKTLDNIVKALGRVFTVAKNVAIAVGTGLYAAIKAISKALEWFVTGLRNVFEWVKKNFSKVADAKSVGEVFKAILDGLKNSVMWFLENLGPLGKKIQKVLSEINAGKLIVIGFSIVILDLLRRFGLFLSAITGVAKGVNVVAKGLTSFNDTFKSVLKVADRKNMILGLSIAIATFTASLAALGHIMESKEGRKGIKSAAKLLMQFMVAMAGIIGLIAIVTEITKAENFNGVAQSLTSIALAIGAFAVAAYALSNIKVKDWKGFWAGFAAMIAFLTTAALAVTWISQEADNLNGSIFGILAFAISLKILCDSFANVLKMGFKPEEAVVFLVGIIGIITVVGRITNHLAKMNTSTNLMNFSKFGIHVHTLTIGIGIMLIGVAALAKAILDFNSSTYATFDDGIKSMVEIFAMISAAIFVIGGFATLWQKGYTAMNKALTGVAALFISIALTMAIISAVLDKYVDNKDGKFDKILNSLRNYMAGIAAVIAVVLVFTGFIGEAKLDGAGKLFAGMGALIFSISLLIGTITAAVAFMEDKEFHTNKIRSILIAVLVLTGLIVAAVVAFGKIDAKEQKTMAGSLIAVAVIIGLISALFAFITVAYAGWGLGPVLTAILGIALILGVLAVVIHQIGDRSVISDNTKKGLWALMGIIIALFASFDVLITFSSDSWAGIVKIGVAAAAIAGVLYMLTKVLASVSKMHIAVNTAGAIWALMGVIIALGATMAAIVGLGAIEGFEGGGIIRIIATAFAMCVVLMSLVAVIDQVSRIKVDPSAQTTFMWLVIMIAELGVFLVALSLIMAIFPDFGWQEMIAAAGSIAILLVAFVGAMALLSKVGDIKSAASIATFLAFAAAFAVIVGVLVILSMMDIGNVLLGALAMSAIAISIGVVLAAVSKSDAGSLMATGLAFIALAAGITVMAFALGYLTNTINKDNWYFFVLAVIAVIAMTGAMTGLAIAASLLNDACGVVPLVLAAMALNFLTLAIAIAAVGWAVSTIIHAIQDLIECFADLSTRSAIDTQKMKDLTDIIGSLGTQFVKIAGGVAVLALSLVLLGVGSLAASAGFVVMAVSLVGLTIAASLAAASIFLLALSLLTLLTVLLGPFLLVIAIMPEIGQYLMEGLDKGLSSGGFQVLKTIGSICSSMFDYFVQFFQIGSPSKVFRWIGDCIMTGFIRGLIDKFPALADVLEPIAQSCYEIADEIEAAGDTWSAAASVGAEHAIQAIQDKLDAAGLDFSNITGQFAGLFGTGMHATDIIDDTRIKDSALAHANAKERWIVEGYESAAAWEEAHKGNSLWDSMMPDLDDILPDMETDFGSLTDSMGDFGDAAGGAADKVDELTQSITNALDVFTEFNSATDLTAKQVLRNFMSQITGVTQWSKEVQELTSRGLNSDFLSELIQSGPEAYEKVHAMYEMTDQQISLFNKMYEEKLSLQETTAAKIAGSFNENAPVVTQAAENLGEQVGDSIAEGTKAGTEQATRYVEQYVDDGLKATDIVNMGYDDRGFKLTDRPRWVAEGYDSAEAWEEGHRKACTKMVPVIEKTYEPVAEAATETVQETVSSAANEIEQGIMDADKIGAKFQYVGGVIIPEGIENGLEKGKPGVIEAFASLAYESMEAFEEYMKIEDSIRAVEAFQESVAAAVTSSLNLFDEVKEQEDISAEEMLQRMKENVKRIGKWANDLQSLAARGISDGLLNELQALGPEGADKVHAFTKMTDAQLRQANQAFEASAALPKQVSDRLTKSYAEAGMQTTLGFVEGIDPAAANEVMTALGTSSLDALKAALDINSPSRKTYEAGMYTVMGLVNGVNDNLPLISEAGINMGNTMVASLAADPEALAESIALFFTGLGAALNNGLSEFQASDSMIFFRQTVLDMLNESVGDLVIEPTIKPVIDTSNISANRNVFDILSRGFNVSPTISKASDANVAARRDYGNELREINTTLKSTRSDLAIMRTDIIKLNSAMSGITVTLDGASVGKVMTPYVNQNLGVTYSRDKRRKF